MLTMTLSIAYHSLTTLVDELCELLECEMKNVKFLGDTKTYNVFESSQALLRDSTKGSCDFDGCVRILSAINTCAKNFEELAKGALLDKTYWLQHSYELRTRAEIIATNVLHTAGKVPKFEGSLALLRVSCAYLSKQLGHPNSAIEYTQGALRLTAPESTVELAKKVMQKH